ncbi:hypothetical protein [Streptococcus merionis]|uniref:hypothetical protein n=1 Tax=Streptococcus merionis TaxID=400065 RepID=UPI0035133903
MFDSGAGILTINGVRKYINPASRWFAIAPGTTEIGVSVHVGGQVPSVTATFREAYL